METCALDITEETLEEFDPKSRRYDVVYHCDMLAHFVDPRAALANFPADVPLRGPRALEDQLPS